MSDRMSSLDAAWLHMEAPTNLMMIVALMWLDQPISREQLRQIAAERLVSPYPRFRQRVEEHTLANPRWADDPHFQVDAHIHHIALPAPGDQAALQALVSDLMSTPLDLTRPLWQLHLVDSYRGGCAIIARIHHSIADGISLARVLLAMADDAPRQAPPSEEVAAGFHPLTAIRHRAHHTRLAASALWSQGAALLSPVRLAELAHRGVEGAEELAWLLALPADPPTAFKGELGVLKKAAWAPPMPLATLKDACRALGCTLNDALISAMAGALGRYLRSVGDDVPQIRTFIPVNMRPLDRPVPRTLGNRFSLVLLELPIGRQDPRDRLRTLKARMDALKGGVQAVLNFGLLSAIGATPPRIERLLVDIFGAKASVIMTNVPGPRQPLYLAGARVDGLQFWVPQSGSVGVGVSIFSYDGQVTVAVAADAGLIPDPDAVIAGFQEEVGALIALAEG